MVILGRSSHGQSTIVLVLTIAFFVLFAAGLFSFELNRVEVARQQLKTATEAAALAGAATLASSDVTDPSKAQNDAMNTALTSFQQNSIIGCSLQNAMITFSNPDNPKAGDSSIFIQFLNPNANNVPVPLGDPNGKTVKVTSFFGLQPAFGSYLGINKVTLTCVSSGGVPQLDIALCFDVSASIDDQTPVTFVRRQWNASKNRIDYIIASTRSGSPAGSLAEGPIYNIIVPPATGSAVDSVPPQNLSETNNSSNGNQYPINFSEASGRTGSAVGLRGTPNTGSPPGNKSGSMGTGNAQTFTDCVVNIDGQNHFTGTAYGGYNFPDLATVVEAARGNLESNSVFTSSFANTGVPPTVTPRAGYQAAYQTLAKQNLHPLGDAQSACQVFLQIMNTDCDAHFSLVSFTTDAGSSATDTVNMPNVDSYYNAGGSGNFPTPLIALNPSTGASNYTTCYNALPNTGPVSGTNIGDALHQAVYQLTHNNRKNAKKAIVLFTDGQPTSAGPLDTKDPWNNARLAAVEAKNGGIPIYSVGLAQVPAIIPGETAILNDTNASTSAGGVAAIAGHGGKFFLVTKTSDLRKTFENIARQLVQLVK